MWLKVIQPKVLAFIFGFLALIITFNYIKDLRNKNKTLVSANSTLSEQFTKISNAYKEQGVIYANDKQAWKEATQALGEDFTQRLKDSNAQVRVLHELIATLDNDVTQGNVAPSVTNTGFTQNLRQERSSGPPLTEVQLKYDAATNKLVYTWDNFKEVYKFTLGEWVKKDGGFVSGARVQRFVYGPNSQLIGSEELPLASAEAKYSPEVMTSHVLTIPRLSIYGGPGWDTSKHKWVPTLGVDYRITDRFGVGTGVAGPIVYTHVSLRLTQ